MFGVWANKRAILIAALLFCAPGLAEATSLQLDLNVNFNTPPPSGSAPWVTATFTDGAPGTVNLNIALNLQGGNEYISAVWFNLDTAFDPANLTIARTGGTGALQTSIAKQTNFYPGDGGGSYDIRFVFPTPLPTPANFFDGTENNAYSLTCSAANCPGFNADSFKFFSVPGTAGSFLAAAKVGFVKDPASVSDLNFGYVGAVPEPSSVLLLAVGLAGLAAWRWRGARHLS